METPTIAKPATVVTAQPVPVPQTAAITLSPKANSPIYSLDEALDNERILRGARQKMELLDKKRAEETQAMQFAVPRFGTRRPAASEDYELRRKQMQCWDAANIPMRYRDADLHRLEQVPGGETTAQYARAVETIRSLLDMPGMFVLLGNRGSGKTWMACALVKEFCRQGRFATYLEAMDFFIALQETYGDGSKANASQIERKYVAPELLVLDAMEERGDTDWSDRMLTRLVNKRYSGNKSTLMISNETEPLFNQRVGPSIVDRIRDEGGKIECNWPSLRGRIAH